MAKVSKSRRFFVSRMKEVNGLLERGVFEVADNGKAKRLRIFGSRFVDSIKNEGPSDAFEKSRLIVQGFNDKSEVLTHSPTVQRASQPLQFAVHACDSNLNIILGDVDQAYTQAKDVLQRPIFINPPAQLVFFKVMRPLYGILEAGIYRFKTYHKYQMEDLNLKPSLYDPCFMYTKKCMVINEINSDGARGICYLQTDDSIYMCNETFIYKDAIAKTKFASNPTTRLELENTLKFNGAILLYDDKFITISQSHHIQNFTEHNTKTFTTQQFITERARGAYIAAVCISDVTYGFSRLAQFLNPIEETYK